MSASFDASGLETVIVVGPDPGLIGGMAAVVGQSLSFDFAGRYRAELVRVTVSSRAAEPLHRRIARHLRRLFVLSAAIRRTAASIVHLHTCSGFSFYRSALDLLIARWMGCRTLLQVHGAAFDVFFDRSGPLRRRLIGRVLSRADRVIALSAGWRTTIQRLSPTAKVVVVENAVTLPPVAASPGNGSPCRFLLLARMDVWKGIDDVIAACATLRAKGVAFTLTLAGPPGTAGGADELNAKMAQQNLAQQVRVTGPVRGTEKAKLFEEADVYVQPSHHEGMPIALLEALASGLPVIATGVGAVPEIIEDGRQGLVVPPHQPDRLAKAMSELATNAVRRKTMAHAARKLAETRFSLARLEADLTSLYDEVLRTTPCRVENPRAGASGAPATPVYWVG